jgi:tetratricopeptide (TPR) repeat protein
MRESPLFLELKERIRASIAAGDLRTALDAAKESLVEARATGDEETIDLAVCNRSAVLIELGDFASELAELRPILMRTTNHVVAFSAAYSTARIYQERRDFKKALFYARLAREKSQLVTDHPGRGHALNQLGTLCLLESRIPEAIDAYRRARRIFEQSEPVDPFALAFLDDNLGYCHMLNGEYTEGIGRCLDGLRAFERLGAETYTPQPHLDLCFGYLETQQLDQAGYHGERALALAKKHGVCEILKNGLYLVGEVAHLSGDSARAEECFDELARRYPEVRYLKDFLFAVDLKKVINLRL